MRSNSLGVDTKRCRDGVGADVLGTRSGQIFGHERCFAGAVRSRDDYGVFQYWPLYGAAHSTDDVVEPQNGGQGIPIALTIRSLDLTLQTNA